MTTRRHIVVGGASQAGLGAASALRGFGFDGDITLIHDEPHRPYTRPPLSKGVHLPVPDDVQLRAGVAAVAHQPRRSTLCPDT
jgi:NADPH-dependent 2,4-dienoyl-CoA reductase/sulfur reductase-like enzyme